MAVTATYEGYLASTSLTCLGAKEPDHLTTCNTMESERMMFAKGQPCGKQPEILHERDSRAKKHSSQHLLFSRIEVFNSHCGGELDDPFEDDGKINRRQKGSTYGVPVLVVHIGTVTYLVIGKISTE